MEIYGLMTIADSISNKWLQKAAVKSQTPGSGFEKACFVGEGKLVFGETQTQSEGFEWTPDKVLMPL